MMHDYFLMTHLYNNILEIEHYCCQSFHISSVSQVATIRRMISLGDKNCNKIITNIKKVKKKKGNNKS